MYQRKSDGLYIGVVDLGRDGAGKRRRKTVSAKTKRECKAKLRELERLLDDGIQLGVSDRTTVEQWMRHWLEEIAARRIRPRTYITYRSLVNRQVVPTIGQYRLVSLTPANVREMVRLNEAAQFSSSTVVGAFAVLKAGLRDAVRERLIPRNPCELVDPPRLTKADRPALTADQVRHFMRVAVESNDRMVTRWAAAFTLGLRQGEALGLEWNRVLFDREPMAQLDLSWALSPLPQVHGCGEKDAAHIFPCGRLQAARCPDRVYRVTGDYAHRPLRGALALTPPKTDKSIRRMPLLAPMATMLQHHRELEPENAYGLVWVDARGHPIHPTRDAANWYAALERAGLPKIPLHAARHTTATLLLEAGVPLHIISQVLGHSSTDTTELYAHVDTSLAAAALGKLDDLLPIGH